MKRCILVLAMLLLLGSSTANAAEILFTVNANDNANQLLKFAGYEFKFNHMDHRAYLYKDKNANNGFQWTTSVVSCWLKKESDPETKNELWHQFFFGVPIVLVEPGQVYTKYVDGRNIQMSIEKIAYFTGYRTVDSAWKEETLPKYITVKIIVH